MFAFDKPLVWVIILLIVIVLFGASRLPEVGKSLGRSINNFKDEMSSETNKKPGDKLVSETVEAVKPMNSTMSKDEVVITKRERTREDGTVEIIEERVIRKG